jgi:hypothetical protein
MLETPVVCPHNVSHTIDLDSISIQDTITVNSTIIQDDTSGTNGIFKGQGYVFDVPAVAGISEIPMLFPPVNTRVSNIIIGVGTDNVGDQITVLAFPDTSCGTTTTETAASVNVIDVSPTVIINVKPGYAVKIDGQDLGYVLAVDSLTNKITVQNNTNAIIPINTPVLFSIVRLENVYFAVTGNLVIGSKTNNTSFAPALMPTVIKYNNVSGIAKKLAFHMGSFY